jgi:hypothetical protein
MSSYLSVQRGYEGGSCPRHIWGQRNVDTVTLGGTDLVPVLTGGHMKSIPRNKACVVFTKMSGQASDFRGDLLGFFDLSEAWQLTSCQCDRNGDPYRSCTCKRQEGLPFFGDSITPLGDIDWTNEAHLNLIKQCARDWLGGKATMDIMHVHTHHYSLLQCLLFKAQEVPVLLEAIVPLWQSFCRGHLVFEGWTKITIQMTHDSLLNDQTQKMMAHVMTQWLHSVKPSLFLERPVVPINRLLWMRMLATTIRRSMKHGSSDVSKNPGLAGIYLLVPGLGPFAETSHLPLDSGALMRFRASYTFERDSLKMAFTAQPGAPGALMVLTEHLKTGAPLTKTQAQKLLAFCGSHSDQSEFPDWAAMGIIAAREKVSIERNLQLGPFQVTTFKGIEKTLRSELEPYDETTGFLKCSKSTDWCGAQPTFEGDYVFLPDYTGIARAATGSMGEYGVGNWRVSYGTLAEADVLSPKHYGYSSAGVFCDPTITGRAKWINPRAGDMVPACDYPVHISFRRPELKVTVQGKIVLKVDLRHDEYPLIAFKGVFAKVQFLPVAASNSSSSAAPVKSVSWMEAMASGGAGAPPPNRSMSTTESKMSDDPVVSIILAEMRSNGFDSVMTSMLNATMPTGPLTDFEKELTTALAEIGKKGVAAALKEAQSIFSA